MFEAYDSYHNMESVFGNYYEQLTAIIQKETLTGRGKEYPTRVFIFGDTEYLCKTFGHMGPLSSYSCLWCTIPLRDMRNPNGTSKMRQKAAEPDALLLQAYNMGKTTNWGHIVESFEDEQGRQYQMSMTVTYPTRVFIFGDTEYLCKTL